MIRHLFVYGTLRPGDVRWHLLEPFVVDEGWPDRVSGTLFDTGLDYPAAVFGGEAFIHGHTFTLLEWSLARALDVLDEVEGIVDGNYSRTDALGRSGAPRAVTLRLTELGDRHGYIVIATVLVGGRYHRLRSTGRTTRLTEQLTDTSVPQDLVEPVGAQEERSIVLHRKRTERVDLDLVVDPYRSSQRIPKPRSQHRLLRLAALDRFSDE